MSQRALLLCAALILGGCGTTSDGFPPAAPSVGASPARAKWTGPPVPIGSGQLTTTLYYGPWQCNRAQMTSCQKQCPTSQPLMGCIWMADMKFDWAGEAGLKPAKAGTRYAFFHCCCAYPERTTAENTAQRRLWEGFRSAFRKDWSSRFGT